MSISREFKRKNINKFLEKLQEEKKQRLEKISKRQDLLEQRFQGNFLLNIFFTQNFSC